MSKCDSIFHSFLAFSKMIHVHCGFNKKLLEAIEFLEFSISFAFKNGVNFFRHDEILVQPLHWKSPPLDISKKNDTQF